MILAACCRHQRHCPFREVLREVSGDENMRFFSEDSPCLTKYSVFVSNILHNITDDRDNHRRSSVTTHSIEHQIERNGSCGEPWLFVFYPEQVL